MKIEHVALNVNDLEGAKRFFTRFFGATAGEKYHNPKTGLQTYFLSFEDGSRLEIMARPQMNDVPKALYQTGYTHLAFSVGGKEKVDSLTKTLADNGFEVLSGPRTTGDGYYESNLLAFEGNQIEITE